MTKFKIEHPIPWPFPRDFGGMNAESAKRLGFHWSFDEDTIAIQPGQGRLKERRTIRHEEYEDEIERHDPDISYPAAHRAALHFNPRSQGRRKR